MSNTMHLDLKSGIRAVSKQVNLDIRVSSGFLSEVNDVCEKLLTVLVKTSLTIKQNCKRVEISPSDVKAATKVILPKAFSDRAINEGVKAVNKFSSNEKGSRSARAGLIISVPKVDNMFRYLAVSKKISTRFSQGSIIFIAAVIEYIIAELTQISGDVARINAKTISKKHLDMAIEQDDDAQKLMQIITSMS